MKKIININFHSRVVPIEETAYEILQQYIESLRRHFANEEGRDEIISDIENRFAELFSETLKKGAACITDADVNAIIASMGRPEDFEDEESRTAGTSATGAGQQGSYSQQQQYTYTSGTANEPRRLSRADNDKILGGVASGLANYLNIDPAIVRIIFVLMCFGGGAGLLLYIILWVVLPTKSLPANARKRLYRDTDNKVIGGVASGLAAYFHIEVWIPRLIFIAPLVLSAIASIFRSAWFDWDGPVFFTGGFGGTLFITYIVLWIVMPEAVSASEKLEMRGEKVDLESIKNTIKSDLGNFSKRAKDMGSNISSDMKSTFQKTGEQVKQSTQNFASEAYPAARRAGSGIGHAIGVLFKAFFLFIAGCIAFGLIMALFGLVFRGHNLLTLKNYILSGFWQNILAWSGFILFLVIPIVGLLTWLIRRITGVRSRHHYLTYIFVTLWVIGLFCILATAGVVMNNFRSRQHVEEEMTLSNPSHGRLVVKSSPGRHDYFDGDWWFDFHWDRNSPFYNLNDDSVVLNTVRINVIKSDDSSYHVRLIKFSHGQDAHIAHDLAQEIKFTPQQSDSILYLPQGFSITRDQKFRNQQVLVVVAVPLGKHINISHNIDQYQWFNIDVHNSHIRWNRKHKRDDNDDWRREWDEDINIENSYDWSSDVDYVMTPDGLVSTSKRSVDNEDKRNNKQKEDKNKKDNDDQNSDEDPGYRYKRPAVPPQPKAADTVKKTAARQAVTDSHLYLLSALFQ